MSLLESLLCLGIMLLLLGTAGSFTQMHREAYEAKAAADDLYQLTITVSRYAKDHMEDCLSSATETSGLSFVIDTALPEALAPYSAETRTGRNIFQQGYTVFFRKRRLGNEDCLMIFLLTNETETQAEQTKTPRFRAKSIPQILRHLIGTTAPVAANMLAGSVDAENCFSSQNGSLSLTSFGITGYAGQTGVILTFLGEDTYDAGDFLYRTSVSGHPELNRMETTLDMSNESIDHVSSLGLIQQTTAPHTCDADHAGSLFVHEGDTGDTDAVYICKKQGDLYQWTALMDKNTFLLRDAQIVAADTLIAKPDCASGANAEIFVSPVAVARNDTDAPPVVAFQAYAEDTGLDGWRVRMRVMGVGDTDWRVPTGSLAEAQVLTICRPAN